MQWVPGILALSLFMPGIRADDPYDAFAPNNLALLAYTFY